MTAPVRARRWRWAIIAVAAAAVVAVAGPFAWIHLVEGRAPAPLAVTAGSSTTAPAAAGAPGAATGLDGAWKVTGGSQAGYRVKEVLFGQDTEAVGRTTSVSGQLTIKGASVTAGSVSVDLTSVQSDKTRRDTQFQTRIMDTSSYPTATFKLSSPISLGSVPAQGATVSAKASGQLTLHGTTRDVTVDLSAKRNGATIQVSGTIPVTFADYDIPNPSFGPAQTEDHGVIEFLLVLSHA